MSTDFELPEDLRSQIQPLVEKLKAEGWTVFCKRPEGAASSERLALHLHGPNGKSAHFIVDQEDLAETLNQFFKESR